MAIHKKLIVTLMTDRALHDLGSWLNLPGSIAGVSAGSVWAFVAKGDDSNSERQATTAKGVARESKPWATWGDARAVFELLDPTYVYSRVHDRLNGSFRIDEWFANCHLRFPVKPGIVSDRFVSKAIVDVIGKPEISYLQMYVASGFGMLPTNYKIQSFVRSHFYESEHQILLNSSFNPAGKPAATKLSTAVKYASEMGIERLVWNWKDMFIPKSKRGSFPILQVQPTKFVLLRKDTANIWSELKKKFRYWEIPYQDLT